MNGEDSSTSVTFEVREYVLPKFEVSVTAPAYIAKDEFTDSQTITVAVSAKYTYGKPTRGTGTVNFWLNRVYQYCSREPVKRISRHFTLSADGRTTVPLSRKDFYQLFCDESSFGSYLNGYGLLVADTTVADSLNGEERTSAASIPLYSQRVQVPRPPSAAQQHSRQNHHQQHSCHNHHQQHSSTAATTTTSSTAATTTISSTAAQPPQPPPAAQLPQPPPAAQLPQPPPARPPPTRPPPTRPPPA